MHRRRLAETVCVRRGDFVRRLQIFSTFTNPHPVMLGSPQKSDIVTPAAERDAAAATTTAAAESANDLAEKVDAMSLVEKEGLEASNDDSASAAADAYIKHPLQNMWTLWFLHPDKNRGWEDRVIPIISFDTVEDFWSIYNHIKTPAEFSTGHDYYLFKTGIK